MMRTACTAIAAAALISMASWAGPAEAWNPLKSRNGSVKKGNKLYGQEKWEEAKVAYGKASLALPEEPGVPFDMGDALYKSATSGEKPDATQLDSAAQAFVQATTLAGSESKQLEASTYYNLGNVRFLEERWGEAIEAYRQSLKMAPGNTDAAFNLALALKKLEEQKKREEEEKKKQEEEQKKQQQQQQQQDQQQQQQDQQQEEKAPVPLTKQEAEAILDALQRGEKNMQMGQQDPSGQGYGKPKVEKDW